MTKSKWFIPLAIIGGLLLMVFIFIGWGSGIYDKAVSLQEEVSNQWGNVQTSYQRRADLVPQLVATVQGAANNENKILREVTQARAGITEATTPEEMEVMGKKINTAINLAFEAYPQIRSTQNFSDLQAQLEGTENRIAVERRNYNEAVKNYNKHVRGFFKRIALSIFGGGEDFTVRKMFEASEGSDKAPEVKFDK
jgi:LemA protein